MLDAGEVAVDVGCPSDSPILIFIAVQPGRRPLATCSASCVVVEGGEPAGAVDGTRSRTRPSRSARGGSSSRALRSHSAMSTALRACGEQAAGAQVAPGAVHRRPGARHVEGVASAHDAGQVSATTAAAAGGAVGPAQPGGPPASTCTVTAVVASQVSVPSASGAGVGNR